MSDTLVIQGLYGGIEIMHWHRPDDVRIRILEKDNSLYFPTDTAHAIALKEALEKPAQSETRIHGDRSAIEVTMLGNGTALVAARSHPGGCIAIFDAEQIARIRNFLIKE